MTSALVLLVIYLMQPVPDLKLVHQYFYLLVIITLTLLSVINVPYHVVWYMSICGSFHLLCFVHMRLRVRPETLSSMTNVRNCSIIVYFSHTNNFSVWGGP
jgi:hypothetical protein